MWLINTFLPKARSEMRDLQGIDGDGGNRTRERFLLIAELHRLVLKISVKSQVSAAPLGRSSRATDDEIGGRRPSGGIDRRDDWSLDASEYWMKSADYFQRKLDRIMSATFFTHGARQLQIEALIKEAKETLRRWERSPLDLQRPESMRDPKWGLFVATCPEDAGTLARWYGCSRQHIYATRKKWRDAA